MAGEGASVDKIRDILFGVQMRDYDKKFARLEERLLKETTDMKEGIKKSLAAFDMLVKQELESLSLRLKGEQEQRLAGHKDASSETKELRQDTQARFTKMDDQVAAGQRELRQQMLDQFRKLTEEIKQKSDEAAKSLERESSELRFDKADRAALAALFSEVALRLKDEFKIPGAENLKSK